MSTKTRLKNRAHQKLTLTFTRRGIKDDFCFFFILLCIFQFPKMNVYNLQLGELVEELLSKESSLMDHLLKQQQFQAKLSHMHFSHCVFPSVLLLFCMMWICRLIWDYSIQLKRQEKQIKRMKCISNVRHRGWVSKRLVSYRRNS